MSRGNQKTAGVIIWIIIIVMMGNMGTLSRLFSTGSSSEQTVTEDFYMSTDRYDTTVEVHEDNSYTVTENMDVSFASPRHGIYRYIPYKGVITEAQENGELVDIPYYARFDGVSSSDTLDVSEENGNKVFRFGDEDTEINGNKNYIFSYRVTPVTNNGYDNAYYNVFPTGWRNAIPAGSRFTIQFPKDFDHDALKMYWGSYGEQQDASDIAELTWSGSTVTGVLKTALPMGNGMTFHVSMEDGYFQGIARAFSLNIPFLITCAVVIAALLVLFFLFGRDMSIIPSIQFQPPAGLDSAAVGYIIDGSVSDEDVTSLLVFWADRGFLKIRETKNNSLAFTKRKELPPDAPRYAMNLFDKVFGTGPESVGKEVLVSDLKYRLADTFDNTKVLLKKQYNNLYKKSSRTARWIATLLSAIPMIVFVCILCTVTRANLLAAAFAICYVAGLILFNKTVDFWYSRGRKRRMLYGSAGAALCITPSVILFIIYGISMVKGEMLNLVPSLVCLIVTSVVCMVLTGFMKKRTEQCVEWMGYLAGLRDFIETAELERMQVIAKDSPQLFYHILPFAYVFGLSDILMDKMKELSLPSPDWYETRSGNPYFDYYAMHFFFHTSMRQAAATIATPKPPEPPAGGSRGGFSGGGFSGGGFSGGGFGGGGGGSW